MWSSFKACGGRQNLMSRGIKGKIPSHFSPFSDVERRRRPKCHLRRFNRICLLPHACKFIRPHWICLLVSSCKKEHLRDAGRRKFASKSTEHAFAMSVRKKMINTNLRWPQANWVSEIRSAVCLFATFALQLKLQLTRDEVKTFSLSALLAQIKFGGASQLKRRPFSLRIASTERTKANLQFRRHSWVNIFYCWMKCWIQCQLFEHNLFGETLCECMRAGSEFGMCVACTKFVYLWKTVSAPKV